MLYLWIIIGGCIGALAVATPIVVIVLVSLASLREESIHSLGGEAPGRGERLARRILGFHTAKTVAPAPRELHGPGPRADTEVRFVHARRPVPDPGKYSASRQSSPNRIGADQRQPAGV